MQPLTKMIHIRTTTEILRDLEREAESRRVDRSTLIRSRLKVELARSTALPDDDLDDLSEQLHVKISEQLLRRIDLEAESRRVDRSTLIRAKLKLRTEAV